MFSRLDLSIDAAPGIGIVAALPWWLPASLFFMGAAQHQWLAFPAMACLIASGQAFLRNGLVRGSGAVSRLEVRDHCLWVTTRSGTRGRAHVAPESRITHRWLWLRVDDGHRNHTLLLSDRRGFRNTEPASLRRLTVWLRYHQPRRDNTQSPAFR